MTSVPRLPRLSESAASRASASSARFTPKLALAASVPAMDWNTRSTGAPRRTSSSVVVTWASTQDWVGMSSRQRSSSSISSSSRTRSGLSPAGLTPITASPLP